jgi:hypothetical protein
MSFLPYLLLAACPLMHFFHHGGHGHHHADTQEGPRSSGPGADTGVPGSSDND